MSWSSIARICAWADMLAYRCWSGSVPASSAPLAGQSLQLQASPLAFFFTITRLTSPTSKKSSSPKATASLVYWMSLYFYRSWIWLCKGGWLRDRWKEQVQRLFKNCWSPLVGLKRVASWVNAVSAFDYLTKYVWKLKPTCSVNIVSKRISSQAARSCQVCSTSSLFRLLSSSLCAPPESARSVIPMRCCSQLGSINYWILISVTIILIEYC